MSSYPAIKSALAAAILALFSCGVSAAPQRVLIDPVLGLRYEISRVKFDPLPAHALANCETMRDNEHSRGVWFIYAQATDSLGRTYYVSSGYEVRHDEPHQPSFNDGAYGVIFFTERNTCTYIDIAHEFFDDPVYDKEMSESVLKLLAADVAKRLVRAFGGADKLRTEIKNQHVDKDTLPPVLWSELKPYFSE